MPGVGEDVFTKAVAMAAKSTMIHKHGAVIVRNGEVIGQGYNHITNFMSHQWSVHSEVAAILSLKKQHKSKQVLADAVMIVVRLGPPSNKDALKNSKPCEKCREAINRAGIGRVFYSC